MVSHAGSRLLADLADGIGLTGAFTDGLRRLRPRGTGHDPGRIAVDLAVMLADGGEAIADLALLRDQIEVFGPVASTATAWRLLGRTHSPALGESRRPGDRLAPGRRDHRGHTLSSQLSLFDLDEGMCHQVFLTDTPHGEGSLRHLEVRHRAHARVEDRIRCGKNAGLGRFPSRHFAINAAWLELALTAVDLLAWTQVLLLDGELASAEPKKLRYRLLHAAARITRGGRRLYLRISATWPWRDELVRAFVRLATLPRPAT
ncbi:Transposase DDE domain group 1 [Streptomyces sp. Ag82_O1-12]|nr:Transposase DDE domain group 1 [Streptomyces sp. Ag82_O1-12]SOD43432.1 Transposase DDE domain group 1 [Streptomyces sp. Ag82_G6-1]